MLLVFIARSLALLSWSFSSLRTLLHRRTGLGLRALLHLLSYLRLHWSLLLHGPYLRLNRSFRWYGPYLWLDGPGLWLNRADLRRLGLGRPHLRPGRRNLWLV